MFEIKEQTLKFCFYNFYLTLQLPFYWLFMYISVDTGTVEESISMLTLDD